MQKTNRLTHNDQPGVHAVLLLQLHKCLSTVLLFIQRGIDH